jgi:YD repeat-containing protein
VVPVDTVTDGKGQVTNVDYDILDRPVLTTFAGGLAVTNDYDDGGRRISRSDATGTTTYAYDALNRLTQENLPGGWTNAYTYDGVGNLTSMADVAGTVSYRYNPVNLVDQLTEPGGAITTFAYDNDDNRTSTTYPNGVVQTAAYDASSRLTSIEGKRGSTVLTRFAYTYEVSPSPSVARGPMLRWTFDLPRQHTRTAFKGWRRGRSGAAPGSAGPWHDGSGSWRLVG